MNLLGGTQTVCHTDIIFKRAQESPLPLISVMLQGDLVHLFISTTLLRLSSHHTSHRLAISFKSLIPAYPLISFDVQSDVSPIYQRLYKIYRMANYAIYHYDGSAAEIYSSLWSFVQAERP